MRRRELVQRQLGSSAPLPWLKSLYDFEDACTRCQRCVERCEEHIIIKASGGFPRIDFKLGECSFCAKCVEACEVPTLFDRRQPAFQHQLLINDHCLPKIGVACQSCGDMCAQHAIQFHWNAHRLREPQLHINDCNNCGACINVCPADAIVIQFPYTKVTP